MKYVFVIGCRRLKPARLKKCFSNADLKVRTTLMILPKPERTLTTYAALKIRNTVRRPKILLYRSFFSKLMLAMC
jgi:hypothetical protein